MQSKKAREADAARNGKYLGKDISDRQVTHLIGLAQGMIADGFLSDPEIDFLHKWLVANDAVRTNPMISQLIERVEEALEDGVIDEDERADLTSTLVDLTGSDFELGEMSKSSSLPLCTPTPKITHEGRRFCFTGTFTFGKRSECEAAAKSLGATAGSLTMKTDFLVIGAYATPSWKHEPFGRKIEKAVGFRDAGKPIHIIGEDDWVSAMREEGLDFARMWLG